MDKLIIAIFALLLAPSLSSARQNENLELKVTWRGVIPISSYTYHNTEADISKFNKNTNPHNVFYYKIEQFSKNKIVVLIL
ncbi:hypothetical protein ACOMICROBIO_NCLOACGD_05348 [Vibrio sp. B1ASS3]|nr:hypothetical protein ACOMICROBIO_NCLOACGD_05348 [Vibrio sp. B1ASS3]CAE6964633.1 hypothetical protein ACOMICROBIO_NCLOACGD_05348 [Vibrio sp. B1ASS3]